MRVFEKILEKIAPDGMSPQEYVVRCAVNSVNASPSDTVFVEWLIDNAMSSDDDLSDEVGELISEGIESGEILDLSAAQGDADSRFASLLGGYVMAKNKRFKKSLFRAVLRRARRGSETRKTAYRLNRAFGFTDSFYFSETEEHPFPLGKKRKRTRAK